MRRYDKTQNTNMNMESRKEMLITAWKCTDFSELNVFTFESEQNKVFFFGSK